MSKGLLEQLAERDVPPAPAELNTQVHQRLNRELLVWHLIDLAVGTVPNAAIYFLRAISEFLKATSTGRFESDRPDRPREAP